MEYRDQMKPKLENIINQLRQLTWPWDHFTYANISEKLYGTEIKRY